MANFTTLIYLTILYRFHFIPPDPITASVPCSRHVTVIGIISNVPSSSCSICRAARSPMGEPVHADEREGMGPYPMPLHGCHHQAISRARFCFCRASLYPGPQPAPHCGSTRCCPPLQSLNLELYNSRARVQPCTQGVLLSLPVAQRIQDFANPG